MSTSPQAMASSPPLMDYQNSPSPIDSTQGIPGSPNTVEPASPVSYTFVSDNSSENTEVLPEADPTYDNDRPRTYLTGDSEYVFLPFVLGPHINRHMVIDEVNLENRNNIDDNSNLSSVSTVLLNEDSNSNTEVQTTGETNDSAYLPASVSSVPLNEDSNSNTEVQTTRETNDSAFLPEAQISKGDPNQEPPAKVRKIGTPPKSPINDMDGETCPICLDLWGNSGDHRLVSLKCGHLFGQKCVERWLKTHVTKERVCPTCKSKAALKDLRFIYARRLVAADTSEVTELQKRIEVLQAEKIRAKLELQKSKIAHRACILEIEALRSTLMTEQLRSLKYSLTKKNWRFALEKNLEMSKDGGCRVMTYNCRTYELYVTQKSMNNLFPGYGIRKVSCVDYKLGQFIHLHPKSIRDMTYSQPRDLLLSVGLDSTARVVERGIPRTIVNVGYPLWSCAWDYLRTNEFYVGGIGGNIQQYDIRNTSSCVQRLFVPGEFSPVVSIRSTEYGLLSCQLKSSWLWIPNDSGQWEPRALPVEGPFMSMTYDNESHRALVSCRPSANTQANSRLNLCKLMPSETREVTCQVEQSFHISSKTSVMSRAAFVSAPGASWAAAHSESESTLFLHGLNGTQSMSLPAAEPALDVLSVQLNGDTVLAALSESRLRIYKAFGTTS